MAENSNGILSELMPLQLEHLELFKRAFAEGQPQSWVHYFPLLFFYARGKKRELLFCEDHGSICLFLHTFKPGDEANGKLALYFPPVPMHPAALHNSIARVCEFNQNNGARIVWVEEQEAAAINELPKLSFRLDFREDEFFYNPGEYLELAGKKFAKIRLGNNHLVRESNPVVSPFRQEDAEECLRLLTEWEHGQGQKYDAVIDRVYTRHCLNNGGLFNDTDLFGKVIRIDNEIKSFSFSGQMYDDIACGFIVKSDHTIPGLNNFMLCEMFRSMASFRLVNGASDMGNPGLRAAKQALRPVATQKTFQAIKTATPAIVVPPIAGKEASSPPILSQDFQHNALEGLHEITIADRDRYRQALAASPNRLWMSYFPLLVLWGATPDKSYLMEEVAGSLCIYRLRHSPRSNRLDLFLPPLPMSREVLHHCFTRINHYNGDNSGKLLWLPEALQQEVLEAGPYRLKKVDEEYIYSPESYETLAGSRFRLLRSQLKRAEKMGQITARPFTVEDRPGCLQLLAQWAAARESKGIAVGEYSGSRAAVTLFHTLESDEFTGRVYEIDGVIRGLAFGGPLVAEMGCAFMHITDPLYASLGYYVPYEFFRSMDNFEYINDAGTDGLEGLVFMKNNLVPHQTAAVYRVRQQRATAPQAPVHQPETIPNLLKQLTEHDYEIFNRCFTAARKQAWISFFPFLYSLNRNKSQSLYWEMYRGSLCLYHLGMRGGKPRLNLFMPPVPFRASTLDYAIHSVNRFNNDDKGQILWVDEKDRDAVTKAGYTTFDKETEYLYSRQSLADFAESLPADTITIRPYERADEESCLALLKKANAHYRQQGGRDFGYRYKAACIKSNSLFPKDILHGEVLLVDNVIVGCCFGGRISPEWGSIFITVTDPDRAGLKTYQQAHFASNLEVEWINNSAEEIGEPPPYLHQELPSATVHRMVGAQLKATGQKREDNRKMKDINASIFIAAAEDLGLEVNIISAAYSYGTISHGEKQLHVYHNATSLSDVATRKMTHHKYLSQKIFRQNNIPVPESKLFNPGDEAKILHYAEKWGEVVIKPVKGSRSVGVTIDPKTPEELLAAVREITSGKLMVERLIHGDDYRVLIFQNEVIDILKWVPPFVTGNGLDTIHVLVEEKNAYFGRHGLYPIVIDFNLLDSRNLSMEYVPGHGEIIQLHADNEHFLGAETVRIDPATVHPDNITMFIAAAKISGLQLAGLDYMSRDLAVPYTENGGCINEINSTPHIWPHYFADGKEDSTAIKRILSGYFKLSHIS